MAEYMNLIVLLKIELEDPLENLGVKLVRQAGARTNDIAGDGSTTSIILARGLIAEGMKVCLSLSLF
jgi:chaperonin GroEL